MPAPDIGASNWAGGACAVPLPDGRTRFYFEAARADGSHDLMTSVA